MIILDKSGSMGSMKEFAIQGFNETVKTIKEAQKEFADTQEHYVSLVTFCNCGNNMVLDKVHVNRVKPLTSSDYRPCCGTPLYDAMGYTLQNLENELKNKKNYTVLVTIITDGYENSSHHFSGRDISKLVERLKEQGWMFAYMGTDHDVESFALSISITNTIHFEKSEEGLQNMFDRERHAKRRYYEEMQNRREEFEMMNEEERRMNYAEMSNRYFKEEPKAKNTKFTPEHIDRLSKDEIFVFGSNLEGRHGGGAARTAVEKFGAIWGQGVGLQGQCYAIPTMHGGVNVIKPYVDEFIDFAKAHPEMKFFVTRIGCGIAGFKDEEIAPLFAATMEMENVYLPKSFVLAIKKI